MSEPADQPITEEELFDFFDKQHFACPVCGNIKWGATGPDEPVMLMLSTPKQPVGTLGRVLPAHPAVCINCGFVRFHDSGIVEERIAEERKVNG